MQPSYSYIFNMLQEYGIEKSQFNNFSASAIGGTPQREIYAITMNRTIKIITN